MPVPLAKQKLTVSWVDKHVRPLITSLASQGHLDGIEAMDLLEGLDGLLDLMPYLERHGETIKRAVAYSGSGRGA